MTVSMRVRSTLAALEGVLADFRAMHSGTTDENTRKIFDNLISETGAIVEKLRGRIEEMVEEEPEYREE